MPNEVGVGIIELKKLLNITEKRLLQQEAARDEDEIRQLKGLVALAGPLPELPPPSGGTATTSLGHHYQAGGVAGSSSAVHAVHHRMRTRDVNPWPYRQEQPCLRS